MTSVFDSGRCAALSGLAEAPIRYIVDDCRKFVQREQRHRRAVGLAAREDAIVPASVLLARAPEELRELAAVLGLLAGGQQFARRAR